MMKILIELNVAIAICLLSSHCLDLAENPHANNKIFNARVHENLHSIHLNIDISIHLNFARRKYYQCERSTCLPAQIMAGVIIPL
jgi:hypothetical protein